MTQDEIIEMAKLAGWEMDNSCVLTPQVLWYIYQGQLEAFAKLVAAKERERVSKAASKAILNAVENEREACADLIHELAFSPAMFATMDEWRGYKNGVSAYLDAIRARGETTLRGEA